MAHPSDHITLKCPHCEKTNVFHRSDIRKTDGSYATNVRNPHSWDGSPTGSFWRGCDEAPVTCEHCGEDFHVDCD